MTNKVAQIDYVNKALELALSGKFKTYIEVEAALILLGYPSLKLDRPTLAQEIDTICRNARAGEKGP